MTNSEDFDARLATRLRRFTDQSLTDFDTDVIAAAAMDRRRATPWPALLTAAAAVFLVVAGVSVANALSDSDTGQSPIASAAAASSAASEQPTLAPTPAPTPAPTDAASTPLTEAAAVAAARVAAPQSAERPAVSVEAGPVGELMQPLGSYEWSTGVDPDRWVWVVVLLSGEGLDSQGSIVVIDYLDGRVYGVMNGRG